MKPNKTLFCLLGLLPLTLYAEPMPHMIVAPACLVKKADLSSKVIAKENKLNLLSVNDIGIEKLIKAKQDHLGKPCGGFMDVTPDWQEFSTAQYKPGSKASSFLATFVKPDKSFLPKENNYAIKFSKEVNQLIKNINPQNIWDGLTSLTNFENRNANSTKGVAAAKWITQQIKNMADTNNRSDVTVSEIPTTNYQQPSIVVKIGESNDPGIVVGGHMDTFVFFNNRQPGADDDGSGSATIMEAARTILASGMKFKKPLYFIWYAAEEEGLIGSREVVRAFKKQNIPVQAAIQFDMTGYAYKNDPTIWLLNDNVNKDLTSFVGELVTTYVQQSVKYTTCGYGCSDHASWHSAGIPAAAPFEAEFGKEDPYIHSIKDTMDVLSLNHMTDYAKLAVAYAVELAEPVK